MVVPLIPDTEVALVGRVEGRVGAVLQPLDTMRLPPSGQKACGLQPASVTERPGWLASSLTVRPATPPSRNASADRTAGRANGPVNLHPVGAWSYIWASVAPLLQLAER